MKRLFQILTVFCGIFASSPLWGQDADSIAVVRSDSVLVSRGALQLMQKQQRLTTATTLFLSGEYEECIRQASLGMVQGADPSLLLLIAQSYGELGQADSLASFSRRYLDIVPDNPVILSKLAEYEYDQGNYDLAAEYATRVLDKKPEDARALFIKGYPYYLAGNMQQANEWFGKAYREDKDNFEYIYMFATSYNWDQDRFAPEAKDLFSAAVKMLQPQPDKLSKVYTGYGNGYLAERNWKEALKYYEMAWDLDRSNLSVAATIGNCCEQLEDYIKARQFYELYLSLGDKDSKEYAEVEKNLEYVKLEIFMNEK